MEKQEWAGQEEQTVSEISVKELEHLCETARLQDDLIKKMESEVKAEKKKLTELKDQISDELTKLGKSNYQSEAGTFYKATKFSIKTPKTEEEKKAFFNWCKDKGIFWHYASVNSIALNKLYRETLEAEGPEFEMPGVEAPTSYEELRMRK